MAVVSPQSVSLYFNEQHLIKGNWGKGIIFNEVFPIFTSAFVYACKYVKEPSNREVEICTNKYCVLCGSTFLQ